MANYNELTRFVPVPERPRHVGLDAKIAESTVILGDYILDASIRSEITHENFRLGIIPRLSPYDNKYLPSDTEFIRIPEELQKALSEERSHDLMVWNTPSQVLRRLRVAKVPFVPPVKGESTVMKRLANEGRVVSFDNLRIDSPEPKNGRQSRSQLNRETELNIMGQGRIPFVLGSVPDVGSHLSYVTMAQANGMAFISRDKILSDINEQVALTEAVINTLQEVDLPFELYPNEDELYEFMNTEGHDLQDFNSAAATDIYFQTLRNSWIANVGAAIEATPKGVERAMALRKVGCSLFRIYSPEGGTEIIETIKGLKEVFSGDESVKIVGGQIMDPYTAKGVEEAGADAIFIGVAGGSQCTTSVNADIPVKTPNLLHELRGNISIPIGIEGGGVGTHIMTAFALGASFVSKPGEIGVSWEGAGGQFIFKSSGKYYMPYGGEASVSAKWWKDSKDTFGRPRFVEGETGVREIPVDDLGTLSSQTRRINSLRNQEAVGLVFQRANSISELHQRSCKNIVEVTPEASALSQAYAT